MLEPSEELRYKTLTVIGLVTPACVSRVLALAASNGYISKFVDPTMPGGSTCVSGGATWAPPRTWTMAARFIAYSRACRNGSLAMAPLLFGEAKLKTMLGWTMPSHPG